MALCVNFNGPLRPRLFALACFLLLLYVGFTRSYYRDIASKTWHNHVSAKNPFKNHAPLSPFTSPVDFPKKIWYKLGSKGQSPESKEWTATCLQNNPEWEASYLNDTASDEYVQQKFAGRPDIVSTYNALSVPILKADMMRYLLLYSEGGLWNDLDVECGKTKIEDWLPKEFDSEAINLVVGVEFDAGYNFTFEHQFATWAVLAKPKTKHLEMVIDYLLASVSELANQHNTTIPGITMEMIPDVVTLTGPVLFTRSIVKSLSLMLNENISGDNFTMLMSPKLIGDVLVLPGWSFASTVNTYEEGVAGEALVLHHYSGSWKNVFGGEKG